jgi:hypothetical protein
MVVGSSVEDSQAVGQCPPRSPAVPIVKRNRFPASRTPGSHFGSPGGPRCRQNIIRSHAGLFGSPFRVGSSSPRIQPATPAPARAFAPAPLVGLGLDLSPVLAPVPKLPPELPPDPLPPAAVVLFTPRRSARIVTQA